jgi:hypothetical protein
MTRKDYELIAKVLRNSDEIIDEMALEAIAENFANELESTNPRFNPARFLSACGVK